MNHCLTCNSELPTKGRCLTCKRNDHYLKQGHSIERACKTCFVFTRLYSNSECSRCLELQGLRECSSCHEIKGAFISFRERQAVCRECRNPTAHLTPEEKRKAASLKKYGLTYDQYMAMVHQQDGRCAICRRRPGYALVVDHETGTVRGLLCHGCNIGIGNLKRSLDVLDRAREYLVNGGTPRGCSEDPPLDVPAAQDGHRERRALYARVVTLEERLGLVQEELRHERSCGGADLVRALAVSLTRELEKGRDTAGRQRALQWLREVVARATPASPPKR